MTAYFRPIARLLLRYFPQGYAETAEEAVAEENRKPLALKHLSNGEKLLLQGNLEALSLFEKAVKLDPENPLLWHRQGLAFLEYASEEGREKALHIAVKYFKTALQLDPTLVAASLACSDALLSLGQLQDELPYFLEARDYCQKALNMPTPAQDSTSSFEDLGEIYWNLGLIQLEIARLSEEAHDVSLAIASLEKAREYRLSAELLNDCGKAYLEMGLLVNDARLYLRAIECVERAVELQPSYCDGWTTLGECYSQLYLLSMDERHVEKGSRAFEKAVRLSPRESLLWSSWGQLLGESGRLCRDEKSLRMSIEKSVRAVVLDPKNSSGMVQWVESLSSLGLLTSRLDLLLEAENKIVSAAESSPDVPDLWLAYGTCLMSFGLYYEDGNYYEMALEKLQVGLSMDRTSAEHWHTFGLIHFHYAKYAQNATLAERSIRFLSRALDLKRSCPALLFDLASVHLFKSSLTSDLSELEKALAILEKLLQDYRESLFYHPEWLFEYAQALLWLGDFSHEETHYFKAVELFSHVLLLHPEYPKIHNRLAICYLELGHLHGEEEFYKKALHFFRLASRGDEEDDQLSLDWGICLTYLAEETLDRKAAEQLYWSAEQKMQKAGRLGNMHAFYHLACLYSLMGRTQEAMGWIHKAFSARALPTLDEIAEDDWLYNVRQTPEFIQFFSDLEAKLHQGREQ
ncbi:MAG: hypothetical protein KGI80_03320 [Verrucomicrobiota bacterium]|nr:hypothetical protein [Verrucomicrobiota bacterium]